MKTSELAVRGGQKVADASVTDGTTRSGSVHPVPGAESANRMISAGYNPDATTRERVLSSILANGTSTAADLAERLGVTSAAIRPHLAMLIETGRVVAAEQRVRGPRGRGRPASAYLLTDTGRAQFYQAYDELAAQALQALVEAAGPQAVDQLAKSRFAAVVAQYQRLRTDQPDSNPVELLAQALTSDGYVASVEELPTGEQLCQHHCPVASVAGQYPQLCEEETKVFSKLLGSHVQRLATIAHGDGVCTTNIPRRFDESLNFTPTQEAEI